MISTAEVTAGAAIMAAGALWVIARYLERIAIAVESLNQKTVVEDAGEEDVAKRNGSGTA
jgi:hypothetical protein